MTSNLGSSEDRLLRVGVLGCGPIAQMAHFDACRKARNTELYAICDAAEDLLEKMAAVHEPAVAYCDYADMLADPRVEAVVVATSDPFHVPLSLEAVAAGKHVLVEKPLGTSVEECEELRTRVREAGVTLQVGNNWRFDPGFRFAGDFIAAEMGERIAIKVWYYDSVDRYAMTDNLLPVIAASESSRRPEVDPRADRRRYLLMTHGAHALDAARFAGGEIAAVSARHLLRAGSHCWFVAIEYADGCLGHLDLCIPQRGDVEFGFRALGEHGSVLARGGLIWYHKSSYVECFSQKDGVYRRPLGEDAYSYRLQLEGFAGTILEGEPQHGADADDGTAAVRALAAVSQSSRRGGARVAVADVEGGV